MSSTIYNLKLKKFVSRRIFVDLLLRLQRALPITDYAYIGFGGVTLEDHKLMHQVLGMDRLISIEHDIASYYRQKFNAPYSGVDCAYIKSSEMTEQFDRFLDSHNVLPDQNIIVWLDYEEPSTIHTQLGEFQSVLRSLRVGDVVRITLNSAVSALPPPYTPDLSHPDHKELRFRACQERLDGFLGTEFSAKDMTTARFPTVIHEAIKLAADEATRHQNDIAFQPLLLETYADGQSMSTATGIVVDSALYDQVINISGLRSWPFYSGSWEHVEILDLPDLTPKEIQWLDQYAKSDSGIRIPFPIDGVFKHLEELDDAVPETVIDKLNDFILDYQRVGRFLPSFRHVVN